MNPLCKNYIPDNSGCTSCYDPYVLVGIDCYDNSPYKGDPNCVRMLGNKCTACANYFYLPDSGVCTRVNPLCLTYNEKTGACESCFDGYYLSGTICLCRRQLLISPSIYSFKHIISVI